MKAKRVSLQILFYFILLLLLLPLIQQQLKIIDSGKIYGVTTGDTSMPCLSLESWFNDSFQIKSEHYIKQKIGFRPDFIRLHNQVEFSAFKSTNAHIVIGKNNNLFEKEYIHAYLGSDFIGTDNIRKKLHEVKYVQDQLEQKGIQSLLVYAPSKARFHPQDIPDRFFKNHKKSLTNYDEYIRLSDSLNIHHINVNGWFTQIKNNSQYLLFSNSGIHWTDYGALITADSIQKYFKNGGLYLPEINWNEYQANASGRANETEKDLENLMNLILPINDLDKFYHPSLNFSPNDNKEKLPKLLVIGDSFVWQFVYMGIFENISSYWQYWSYNNEVFGTSITTVKKTSEIDVMGQILQSNYVLIINTEFNLTNPGHGFYQHAYEYFKNQATNK